jgi:hypothetical protein
MKKFKYHTTFATKHIRLIVPEDHDQQLALASLKDLKDVLPQGLDIDGNPDLVFHSFNACIANRVNLNDDGINTADALAIASKFIHKPEDLEHNRKFVVGTIISQGFSEFLTNRMLTADEVKDLKTPFNITLGGVVWSIFNPDFAEELIESSDESSPKYEMISASWEMGFDNYHIALGSRDLAQAEIITDPKQIEEFQPMLRIAKGSGMTKDGVPVYRVITGEALPLGIGFTTTPAAEVKGVMVASQDRSTDSITITAGTSIMKDMKIESKGGKIIISGLNDSVHIEGNQVVQASTEENTEKNEKISSQAKNLTVKSNSNMKLKTLEDITDENLKEATASQVKNFFGEYLSDKIDEKSTEFAEQLEAKEKEAKAKQEQIEKANKDLQDTLAQVQKLQDDLRKEQEARATEKANADFNNRMTDLDSKFDLGDKEREFIAKDIRGLDDNAFATWFEKFEVFAAAKKKKMDAEDDPNKGGDSGADEDAENKKKKKNASASVDNILNKTKENENELPPNNTVVDTSLKQEFADAFKLEDFKFSK